MPRCYLAAVARTGSKDEMRVYIANNWNKEKLAVVLNNERLGLTYTPFDYQRNKPYRYFLDNGAFGAWTHGRDFDEGAFLFILTRLTNPDFAVIPDIVAGGKKSLEYSIRWRTFLPDSFKWYLAVQDGMTPNSIPDFMLRRVAGLFVGGSMPWKLETMAQWIEFAHSKKLYCHVGRIGDLDKIKTCERAGADSVDSSNFARHKKNWRQLMDWLYGKNEALLFAEV